MPPAARPLVTRLFALLVGIALDGVSPGAALAHPAVALDARGGADAYHNLATGDGFSEFRAELALAGIAWFALDSFSETDLATAAGVILLQPYSPASAYTPAEIAALTGLAGRGGGLLILADGGSGSTGLLDPLAGTFGVTLATTPSEALGALVGGFHPHPLTAGVGTVAVDYQRRLSISAPALDLTPSGGAADTLAVSGRAVFLGDSSVLMNPDPFADASIAAADNRQLARNLISFVAVPEPTALVPAALLAVGSLAWAIARRRRGAPARRRRSTPAFSS